MKNFVSTRVWLTQNSTTTILELDGQVQGYVIEPPVRIFNIQDNTAIPQGTYDVGISFSEKFNRNLPYLKNVHGYVDGQVRIHPGNFENSVNPATGQVQRDSEACQVVGAGPRGIDYIARSLDMFTRLFLIIDLAITDGEMVKYAVIDILKPVI
jgi:hypothetical protein